MSFLSYGRRRRGRYNILKELTFLGSAIFNGSCCSFLLHGFWSRLKPEYSSLSSWSSLWRLCHVFFIEHVKWSVLAKKIRVLWGFWILNILSSLATRKNISWDELTLCHSPRISAQKMLAFTASNEISRNNGNAPCNMADENLRPPWEKNKHNHFLKGLHLLEKNITMIMAIFIIPISNYASYYNFGGRKVQ